MHVKMTNKKSKKKQTRASSAAARTPSLVDSLGDILLCPICMHTYAGKILQCDQGHTVCQKCQHKLTECPTCHGSYALGTRNYALEQIITKFQEQININTKSTNLASGEVLPVDEPEIAKRPLDAKSASMSLPSSTLDSDEYEAETSENENLNSDNTEEEFSADINASDPESRPTTPLNHCQKASIKAPLQPKGVYACRMIGCNARLPICRMLNHVRYFHSDFLHTYKSTTEPTIGGEDSVVFQWTIPSRTSSRKIVQIPHFGLFFFFYNVRKEAGETEINSWLQSVRPNKKAREFYFQLNLEYGDAQVSYSDYVYGESSDESYIQQMGQCLHVQSKNNFRTVSIELTISRMIVISNEPRHSNTEIIVAEETIEPVNVKTATGGKGRKKKNRKH